MKSSVALLGYRKMNGDGMDKEKGRESHMRQEGGEGNEHTKGTVHKKKEIIGSFGGSCVVYNNVHQKNDNAFGG
jgi:hypothetical protein